MLFLVLAVPVRAQPVPIEVTGAVSDELSGAPVASARLAVLDPSSGDTLASGIFTDGRGRYAVSFTTEVGIEEPVLPDRYRLFDIHPNPSATGHVPIRYATPANRPETPELEIYDILGRRVDYSRSMAAGVYFVRLRFEGGHVTATKRFALVGGGAVTLPMEQVRLATSSESHALGKRAAGDAEVRFVVEKPGFRRLDVTRRLSDAERNVHDFSLEREGAGQARLAVRVADAAGEPLVGVHVRVVDDTLAGMTNVFGEAVLDSVYTGVPVVVALSKEDYAEQFVRAEVHPGMPVHLVDVVMRPRAAAVVVQDAQLGGVAVGDDGARVELPADALVDPGGEPVTGAVDVSLTSLDVTGEGALAAFPGTFAGVAPSGEQKLLMTLGVTEIVLEQNGVELNLAEGQTAAIELPLYVRKNERGELLEEGDAIPLWSLDEGTGLWLQEATGTVVASETSPTGLALRGEIAHFSTWNCDVAADAASVTLTTSEALQTYSSFSGRTVDGSIPAFETYGVGSIAHSVEGSTLRTAVPPNVDVELSIETAPRAGLGGLEVCRWSDLINAAANAEIEREVELTCEPLDAGGDDELLAVPAVIERAIDPVGEVDTYRFESAEGRGVLLSVCQPPFTSSLIGTFVLRAPSGITLGQRPFGSFCGRLTAEADETGLYTVEIDGTFGEPGAYELELDAGPMMPLATPTSGTFDGETELVRHFFRPAPGDVVSVAYGSDEVGGFVGGSIDLYDENFSTASFSAPAGRFGQIAFVAAEDRPHVIELEPGSGVSGAYVVSAAPLDEPLSLVLDGHETETSGRLTYFGERHFYRFDAAQGQLLNIVLDLADARTQLSVKRPSQPFYDVVSHANVPHEAGADELDTGPFVLTETGEWVVEVAHPSRAFPGLDALLGDYVVRIYAPATQPLVADSSYEASIDDPRDFDAYRFTLEEERDISVQTTLESGGRITPRLFDATGWQLAQTFLSSPGTTRAIEGRLAAGTYYIVQEPVEVATAYGMLVTFGE